MAGWKWIAIVTVAAACRPAADDDLADTSDEGSGTESSDESDGSSSDASTSADTGGGPDVPAMESCWQWEPLGPTILGLSYIAALSGGDLIVGGSRAIVRLSADGEEIWTLNVPTLQLQNVVALPDDGFAVMGSWQQAPAPAVLRAYDDNGLFAWESSPDDTPLYSAAWWSAERGHLLALAGIGPVHRVDTFDLEGTLVESMTLDDALAADANVRSIVPLGAGFAVAGAILDDNGFRSYTAAYDATGVLAWSRDDAEGIIDDLASVDGTRMVTATADAGVSVADVTGAVVWSWHDELPGQSALALADDGRVYAAITVTNTSDEGVPDRLVELSADGELSSSAEDDPDATWSDVAWSNGRIFTVGRVSTDTGFGSRVECWDPPS